MKIHIEIDSGIEENEVVIKCKELDNQVEQIEQALSSLNKNLEYVFYKGDMEYFLPLSEILFFQSQDGKVIANSKDDVYSVHQKLFELEESLPRYFMRISKSAIINTHMIYSIEKNLASSSLASFKGTHKSVYISRSYYKSLKDKLNEERLRK